MMTRTERLVLWNQYEILKRLDPDNTKDYETNQEILSHGYEQYYSEVSHSIYAETMSEKVSREVEDILNVFRAIKVSCEKLGYTPKSNWAEFKGFDGNAAGGHYGFAMFVRRTLGLWDELKDAPDNSHGSVLADYQQMLATWRRLGKKNELTEAEIEEIAKSR